MKKFKKYLKFLFVLPLFILALFVNLTISADEIVVVDDTVNTVNTGSLLTYDFEGTYRLDAYSYNYRFESSIQSSTFNEQNYSYNDYYNANLSFINYNSFKDFPNILNSFYLKITSSVNIQEAQLYNKMVPCAVIFNEYTFENIGFYNANNQLTSSNATKAIHIVSENFNVFPDWSHGKKYAYIDIWLYYGNSNNEIGNVYLGSDIRMISNRENYVYVNTIHFELVNDLTSFNTYLDSLDSGGGYDLGFNDGYNEGYEQGVIDSTPTANVTDNLFLSYGIYSNDNQILVNDLFQDSDFTQLNVLKPGIIYNLITDEGASANTILISLKNIESNSGYILNMFNGDYGSFELKIFGNGGKVLYTYVYDDTSYQISQLLSVVGNDIIIDAISFTFLDIENAENFYISFTNTLLNETFQNGFNVGIYEGESIGYDKGYDDGYRLGHSDGYNEGMSSQFNLGSTLLEIADIPIKVLSSMLSFEVLGINVFGLFTGLVTVLVVLWVVKKFIV